MESIFNWEAYFTPCCYSDKLLDKLNRLNNVAINTNKIDLHLIKKAIYYAKTYHAGQVRKSGEPFYSHPLEVAYMVADYLWNTDAIAAAILHDTIEDTSLTYEMIKTLFNNTIANHVLDLTRLEQQDGSKMTAADVILKLILQKKHDSAFIKIIDRIHNLQTTKSLTDVKAQKIIRETLSIFIIAAAHLQLHQTEMKLSELCVQAKFIHSTKLEESMKIKQNAQYYKSLESLPPCLDDDQLLSLIFQNA
jgi:(p)ppGpp synthase/HD superfamily hydrolase